MSDLCTNKVKRFRVHRSGLKKLPTSFYQRDSIFNFAERHRLAPAFIFTKEDLDGDAMAGDIYDFQLTYGYFGTAGVFFKW